MSEKVNKRNQLSQEEARSVHYGDMVGRGLNTVVDQEKFKRVRVRELQRGEIAHNAGNIRTHNSYLSSTVDPKTETTQELHTLIKAGNSWFGVVRATKQNTPGETVYVTEASGDGTGMRGRILGIMSPNQDFAVGRIPQRSLAKPLDSTVSRNHFAVRYDTEGNIAVVGESASGTTVFDKTTSLENDPVVANTWAPKSAEAEFILRTGVLPGFAVGVLAAGGERPEFLPPADYNPHDMLK